MSLVDAKDVPYGDRIVWAAVLRRAVFDFVLYKGVRSKQMEWQHAYRYVFSRDQEYENGLSFEEVCYMFGWEPDYIRRLAKRLTRADVKRIEYGSFHEEQQPRDAAALRTDIQVSWGGGDSVPGIVMDRLGASAKEKMSLRTVSSSRYRTAGVTSARAG